MKMFQSLVIFISSLLLFGCTSTKYSYLDARQSLLEDVARSNVFGKEFVPVIVPAIAALNAYEIGSVFLNDSFPRRSTAECVVPKEKLIGPEFIHRFPAFELSRDIELNASLNDISRLTKIDPGDLSAGFGSTERISWSLGRPIQLVTVDDDILRNSTSNSVKCLMEIVDKDVLVLTHVVTAKETFSGETGSTSNVEVALLEAAEFSFSLAGTGKAQIQATEASPVIWVLLPLKVTVDGVRQEMEDRERLRKLLSFVAAESGNSNGDKIWIDFDTREVDSSQLQQRIDLLGKT